MDYKAPKTRPPAEPFLSNGHLRWAPAVRVEGVTPWEDLETRRAIASSPAAIMALSRRLHG